MKTIYNSYAFFYEYSWDAYIYDELLCKKKNLAVPTEWIMEDLVSSCQVYRIPQRITSSYQVLMMSDNNELNKVLNEKYVN